MRVQQQSLLYAALADIGRCTSAQAMARWPAQCVKASGNSVAAFRCSCCLAVAELSVGEAASDDLTVLQAVTRRSLCSAEWRCMGIAARVRAQDGQRWRRRPGDCWPAGLWLHRGCVAAAAAVGCMRRDNMRTARVVRVFYHGGVCQQWRGRCSRRCRMCAVAAHLPQMVRMPKSTSA